MLMEHIHHKKDITIYAGWSANQVTYKVYRYLENANNENYTLYGDVIEGKAAAGSTLTLLTEANKNQIANTKYVGANLTGGTWELEHLLQQQL